ncbi:MFS transporter [Parasphingorhabdus sp. JC815]|uniref:AmpG family muropeptide MFS transporter n=1 Tax=Parasphingorhabdus sp. JC815 TaxID=3232140 RepID=UPI00345779E1
MSEAAQAEEKPGFRKLIASLGQRKTGMMFIFGFSAGLPYSLLLGTLYAWLSDAKVDLETMGVFSLIGLAYAFKFLWSPVVDRLKIPGLHRLGRRKSWLIPAQMLLGIILLVLSVLNPQSSIGWFSLLAGMGAFASATQDVVIDAWRVDVADEVATLDMLSTVYQLGYRIAALAGGALALFLADAYSWPLVYALMGGTMLVISIATFFAPDTKAMDEVDSDNVLRVTGQLEPKIRAYALTIVGVLWGWALIRVGVFMVQSLGSDPETRPDSVEFIQFNGPLIVIATVIIPAIIAAILEYWRRNGKYVLHNDTRRETAFDAILDHGYRALVLPLADIMGRLGWAAILVLALILSYRITDNIWGSFAYPFYLGELEYTKSEVAVASKFFGVGMTMLGIALGGVCFAYFGRMATLTIGAVTAAASNLLYANLAAGGAAIATFSKVTGFTWLVNMFGADERMAKLMLAITGENLAGGLAGAAFVAYLSSITSKHYSAVQYALLSSLTFLIGTLGRGALGEMIERNGYFQIFLFTAGLGIFAIILCLIEWVRTNRQRAREKQANLATAN